jgi:hypothetical protein
LLAELVLLFRVEIGISRLSLKLRLLIVVLRIFVLVLGELGGEGTPMERWWRLRRLIWGMRGALRGNLLASSPLGLAPISAGVVCLLGVEELLRMLEMLSKSRGLFVAGGCVK